MLERRSHATQSLQDMNDPVAPALHTSQQQDIQQLSLHEDEFPTFIKLFL